jgi:drug/metabolite transporter (DMT)-like permease
MTVGIGIGLAFVAMLCWGFGDFLIQKSTRKLGDWETLFLITGFGTVVLLPFVWSSLPDLFTQDGPGLYVLILAAVVLLLAALLEFEALRRGKLSVVEPIWSFEIPAAALLAYFLLDESITVVQIVLAIILIICLAMVSFRGKRFSAAFFLERGVIISFISALVMGCANFFMGWGGRVTDPIMVNFFTDAVLMIICGLYLAYHGRLRKAFSDLRHGYATIIPMSIADKVAWLAFVASMALIPIAVATALSESYIIIAVLLGLFVDKEKLQKHQKIGLIGAIIAAIVLAAMTGA